MQKGPHSHAALLLSKVVSKNDPVLLTRQLARAMKAAEKFPD